MIGKLSKQHYTEEDGTEVPVLTEEELSCLSIKRGTLTDEGSVDKEILELFKKAILGKSVVPDIYCSPSNRTQNETFLFSACAYAI